MRRHKVQSKSGRGAEQERTPVRCERCEAGATQARRKAKVRAQREGTVVATVQSASRQESQAQARACVAEAAR